MIPSISTEFIISSEIDGKILESVPKFETILKNKTYSDANNIKQETLSNESKTLLANKTSQNLQEKNLTPKASSKDAYIKPSDPTILESIDKKISDSQNAIDNSQKEKISCITLNNAFCTTSKKTSNNDCNNFSYTAPISNILMAKTTSNAACNTLNHYNPSDFGNIYYSNNTYNISPIEEFEHSMNLIYSKDKFIKKKNSLQDISPMEQVNCLNHSVSLSKINICESKNFENKYYRKEYTNSCFFKDISPNSSLISSISNFSFYTIYENDKIFSNSETFFKEIIPSQRSNFKNPQSRSLKSFSEEQNTINNSYTVINQRKICRNKISATNHRNTFPLNKNIVSKSFSNQNIYSLMNQSYKFYYPNAIELYNDSLYNDGIGKILLEARQYLRSKYKCDQIIENKVASNPNINQSNHNKSFIANRFLSYKDNYYDMKTHNLKYLKIIYQTFINIIKHLPIKIFFLYFLKDEIIFDKNTDTKRVYMNDKQNDTHFIKYLNFQIKKKYESIIKYIRKKINSYNINFFLNKVLIITYKNDDNNILNYFFDEKRSAHVLKFAINQKTICIYKDIANDITEPNISKINDNYKFKECNINNINNDSQIEVKNVDLLYNNMMIGANNLISDKDYMLVEKCIYDIKNLIHESKIKMRVINTNKICNDKMFNNNECFNTYKELKSDNWSKKLKLINLKTKNHYMNNNNINLKINYGLKIQNQHKIFKCFNNTNYSNNLLDNKQNTAYFNNKIEMNSKNTNNISNNVINLAEVNTTNDQIPKTSKNLIDNICIESLNDYNKYVHSSKNNFLTNEFLSILEKVNEFEKNNGKCKSSYKSFWKITILEDYLESLYRGGIGKILLEARQFLLENKNYMSESQPIINDSDFNVDTLTRNKFKDYFIEENKYANQQSDKAKLNNHDNNNDILEDFSVYSFDEKLSSTKCMTLENTNYKKDIQNSNDFKRTEFNQYNESNSKKDISCKGFLQKGLKNDYVQNSRKFKMNKKKTKLIKSFNSFTDLNKINFYNDDISNCLSNSCKTKINNKTMKSSYKDINRVLLKPHSSRLPCTNFSCSSNLQPAKILQIDNLNRLKEISNNINYLNYRTTSKDELNTASNDMKLDNIACYYEPIDSYLNSLNYNGTWKIMKDARHYLFEENNGFHDKNMFKKDTNKHIKNNKNKTLNSQKVKSNTFKLESNDVNNLKRMTNQSNNNSTRAYNISELFYYDDDDLKIFRSLKLNEQYSCQEIHNRLILNSEKSIKLVKSNMCKHDYNINANNKIKSNCYISNKNVYFIFNSKNNSTMFYNLPTNDEDLRKNIRLEYYTSYSENHFQTNINNNNIVKKKHFFAQPVYAVMRIEGEEEINQIKPKEYNYFNVGNNKIKAFTENDKSQNYILKSYRQNEFKKMHSHSSRKSFFAKAVRAKVSIVGHEEILSDLVMSSKNSQTRVNDVNMQTFKKSYNTKNLTRNINKTNEIISQNKNNLNLKKEEKYFCFDDKNIYSQLFENESLAKCCLNYQGPQFHTDLKAQNFVNKDQNEYFNTIKNRLQDNLPFISKCVPKLNDNQFLKGFCGLSEAQLLAYGICDNITDQINTSDILKKQNEYFSTLENRTKDLCQYDLNDIDESIMDSNRIRFKEFKKEFKDKDEFFCNKKNYPIFNCKSNYNLINKSRNKKRISDGALRNNKKNNLLDGKMKELKTNKNIQSSDRLACKSEYQMQEFYSYSGINKNWTAFYNCYNILNELNKDKFGKFLSKIYELEDIPQKATKYTSILKDLINEQRKSNLYRLSNSGENVGNICINKKINLQNSLNTKKYNYSITKRNSHLGLKSDNQKALKDICTLISKKIDSSSDDSNDDPKDSDNISEINSMKHTFKSSNDELDTNLNSALTFKNPSFKNRNKIKENEKWIKNIRQPNRHFAKCFVDDYDYLEDTLKAIETNYLKISKPIVHAIESASESEHETDFEPYDYLADDKRNISEDDMKDNFSDGQTEILNYIRRYKKDNLLEMNKTKIYSLVDNQNEMIIKKTEDKYGKKNDNNIQKSSKLDDNRYKIIKEEKHDDENYLGSMFSYAKKIRNKFLKVPKTSVEVLKYPIRECLSFNKILFQNNSTKFEENNSIISNEDANNFDTFNLNEEREVNNALNIEDTIEDSSTFFHKNDSKLICENEIKHIGFDKDSLERPCRIETEKFENLKKNKKKINCFRLLKSRKNVYKHKIKKYRSISTQQHNREYNIDKNIIEKKPITNHVNNKFVSIYCSSESSISENNFEIQEPLTKYSNDDVMFEEVPESCSNNMLDETSIANDDDVNKTSNALTSNDLDDELIEVAVKDKILFIQRALHSEQNSNSMKPTNCPSKNVSFEDEVNGNMFNNKWPVYLCDDEILDEGDFHLEIECSSHPIRKLNFEKRWNITDGGQENCNIMNNALKNAKIDDKMNSTESENSVVYDSESSFLKSKTSLKGIETHEENSKTKNSFTIDKKSDASGSDDQMIFDENGCLLSDSKTLLYAEFVEGRKTKQDKYLSSFNLSSNEIFKKTSPIPFISPRVSRKTNHKNILSNKFCLPNPSLKCKNSIPVLLKSSSKSLTDSKSFLNSLLSSKQQISTQTCFSSQNPNSLYNQNEVCQNVEEKKNYSAQLDLTDSMPLILETKKEDVVKTNSTSIFSLSRDSWHCPLFLDCEKNTCSNLTSDVEESTCKIICSFLSINNELFNKSIDSAFLKGKLEKSLLVSDHNMPLSTHNPVEPKQHNKTLENTKSSIKQLNYQNSLYNKYLDKTHNPSVIKEIYSRKFNSAKMFKQFEISKSKPSSCTLDQFLFKTACSNKSLFTSKLVAVKERYPSRISPRFFQSNISASFKNSKINSPTKKDHINKISTNKSFDNSQNHHIVKERYSHRSSNGLNASKISDRFGHIKSMQISSDIKKNYPKNTFSNQTFNYSANSLEEKLINSPKLSSTNITPDVYSSYETSSIPHRMNLQNSKRDRLNQTHLAIPIYRPVSFPKPQI